MRRELPDDSANNSANDGTEPIRVVPATPDPVYDGPPTAPTPIVSSPSEVARYDEPAPTIVSPTDQVYAERVYEPVAAAPLYTEPVYTAPAYVEPAYVAQPPERRWGAVAMAAALALLVGGIIGLLIGRSSAEGDTLSSANTQTSDSVTVDQAVADQRVNDIFTLLAAEAKQPGGIGTPTPYPALDELLASIQGANSSTTESPATTAGTDGSALADQVTMLQQQNATLQDQLTAAQAERDDLKAQLGTTGTATSDLQALADKQAQQINQLQTDLNTTKTQLDTATATLAQLDPQPLDNVVGMDIAKVRDLAKTHGWTLVEEMVDRPGSTPNTVTGQNPPAGTTMIKGSLLIVEVAKKP